MVYQPELRNRNRVPALSRPGIALALAGSILASAAAKAAPVPAADYLNESRGLYRSGQYFKAARYAFAAMEQNPGFRPESYATITQSLVHAGLYNAASYFFIRTLQMGDRPAIRRVLNETQTLMTRVNPDLLRKYLIRHTSYDDYDPINRSAYLFALAKDAVLTGDNNRAVGYLNGIKTTSPLWPYALQLRGTAEALQDQNDAALSDFQECVDRSGQIEPSDTDELRRQQFKREARDLKARCHAGLARTLYQMDRFEAADRAYDRIPKQSIIWPEMLFEQAWNSFGKQEYNRTLGKLVSYKSPALRFMFNTEADVLTAQSYLALCLYADANDVINEFNKKYAKVGEEVKSFVESNASNLPAFYDFGKRALQASLYSSNDSYRMADRFVRGPYFQDLVLEESEVGKERQAIHQFDLMQPGVDHAIGHGFPGFLDQVLGWRLKTIHLFGGAFVKNSLLDYHASLISDFEKMSFIKLEMLKRAKEKLIYRHRPPVDRSWGNVRPVRRDDQMYWSFNGEFWDDELGDYVFGLESECGK